ncbi:hypothetical protein VPH35_022204 [Triticum aestivum]
MRGGATAPERSSSRSATPANHTAGDHLQQAPLPRPLLLSSFIPFSGPSNFLCSTITGPAMDAGFKPPLLPSTPAMGVPRTGVELRRSPSPPIASDPARTSSTPSAASPLLDPTAACSV